MNHLPEDCIEIAAAQGWDDESIIIHLLGFIRSCRVQDSLADYLQKCANEENADALGL
jgi:hypothetical protein